MDKNKELKRLLIYLFFAFALAWIIYLVYAATGHKWDGSNIFLEQLVGMGMLAPVIANLLTRLVTKEGFALNGKDSLMLGISFKDKKWIYYVFASIIPWIYFELGYALVTLFVPKALNFEYYKTFEIGLPTVFVSPFICIIGGIVGCFFAFGEEGGWRGYMMPKLINLMGIPKAVIVGGIIWGLWHAPLTCVGHNFGTDYPGFPYLGILIMCIDCSFMGIMLTFITIKTGSIWPAAIMHAVNNQNPAILKYFLDIDYYEANQPFPLFQWVGFLIPSVIIGIICLCILLRDTRKAQNVK